MRLFGSRTPISSLLPVVGLQAVIPRLERESWHTCSGQAFSAIRADGSVVTWGNENYGASVDMADVLAKEKIRNLVENG